MRVEVVAWSLVSNEKSKNYNALALIGQSLMVFVALKCEILVIVVDTHWANKYRFQGQWEHGAEGSNSIRSTLWSSRSHYPFQHWPSCRSRAARCTSHICMLEHIETGIKKAKWAVAWQDKITRKLSQTILQSIHISRSAEITSVGYLPDESRDLAWARTVRFC